VDRWCQRFLSLRARQWQGAVAARGGRAKQPWCRNQGGTIWAVCVCACARTSVAQLQATASVVQTGFAVAPGFGGGAWAAESHICKVSSRPVRLPPAEPGLRHAFAIRLRANGCRTIFTATVTSGNRGAIGTIRGTASAGVHAIGSFVTCGALQSDDLQPDAKPLWFPADSSDAFIATPGFVARSATILGQAWRTSAARYTYPWLTERSLWWSQLAESCLSLPHSLALSTAVTTPDSGCLLVARGAPASLTAADVVALHEAGVVAPAFAAAAHVHVGDAKGVVSNSRQPEGGARDQDRGFAE